VVISFGVNYLAVIVAAIAAIVIGILYYGVARLGDQLARINGTTAPSGAPSPMSFGVAIVVALLNAWVLALLSLNLGGSSLADGLLLGVLVWVGFQGTLKAAQVVFEQRSWNGWLLTGVHDVLIQLVMGAIVTVWR
jgi:uncharacterized protein DUF1761